MGSFFGKIVRAGASIAKSPLGNVAKMIPGVGTVLGAASLVGTGLSVANAVRGSGGGGMPSLPMGMGSLPALPGMAGANPIVGKRSIFANDPNIVEALKGFAISKGQLRTSFRSPIKGFVVVRDMNGDPYALPRVLARKYAGWKPSKKPPISVGDHQALLRADRTAKRVKKIMTMVARVDKNVGKGGKVKVPKRGGK